MESPTPQASLSASLNWSTRKSNSSESWKAARPRLVNTALAQENVGTRKCQQCWSNLAVVRCRDCLPRPLFCAECDVVMYTRHPLHNRDASTLGFFQPLPPTATVQNMDLCQCGKFCTMYFKYKITYVCVCVCAHVWGHIFRFKVSHILREFMCSVILKLTDCRVTSNTDTSIKLIVR